MTEIFDPVIEAMRRDGEAYDAYERIRATESDKDKQWYAAMEKNHKQFRTDLAVKYLPGNRRAVTDYVFELAWGSSMIGSKTKEWRHIERDYVRYAELVRLVNKEWRR